MASTGVSRAALRAGYSVPKKTITSSVATGERESHHRLQRALQQNQKEQPHRSDAHRLEHPELTDPFEDRHQHRVEQQDRHREVEDDVKNKEDAPGRVDIRRQRRVELTPALGIQITGQLFHLGHGGIEVDCVRPTYHHFVGAVRHHQEFAKGLIGHKDSGPVRGLADQIKNAAHGVERVGHAAVGGLAQHHQLSAQTDVERLGQSSADHHTDGIVSIQPRPLPDLGVDLADSWVPLEIDPEQRRPGGGLAGRHQAAGQQPGGGAKAPLVKLSEQLLRRFDGFKERRSIAVVGGEDLDVAELDLHQAPLDANQETLEERRKKHHQEHRQRHGGDGDAGAARVAPDVAPGHLEDLHHPPTAAKPGG